MCYTTIGNVLPEKYWLRLSATYRRLTFANTYHCENMFMCGTFIFRNGRKLYEQCILDYRRLLPDMEIYDDEYFHEALQDLLVTLSLEAAAYH